MRDRRLIYSKHQLKFKQQLEGKKHLGFSLSEFSLFKGVRCVMLCYVPANLPAVAQFLFQRLGFTHEWLVCMTPLDVSQL